MRTAIAPTLLLAALALGAGGDGRETEPGKDKTKTRAPTAWAPPPPDREAEAMAFVREHHPELAQVLGPLKAKDPAEYRKAVVEIAQVARSLADLEGRNPKRHELALDAWKAKSRVELLAARLAGSPSDAIRGQLRSAVEAKVDADIRRQKYDLEQAEAAARKLRQSLDHLESHREAVVEARVRALQPKKAKAPGRRDEPRPIVAPPSPPADRQPENRP